MCPPFFLAAFSPHSCGNAAGIPYGLAVGPGHYPDCDLVERALGRAQEMEDRPGRVNKDALDQRRQIHAARPQMYRRPVHCIRQNSAAGVRHWRMDRSHSRETAIARKRAFRSFLQFRTSNHCAVRPLGRRTGQQSIPPACPAIQSPVAASPIALTNCNVGSGICAAASTMCPAPQRYGAKFNSR